MVIVEDLMDMQGTRDCEEIMRRFGGQDRNTEEQITMAKGMEMSVLNTIFQKRHVRAEGGAQKWIL